MYSGAEVAVRAWSGVAPPKEEGRAAGKDCPTRNVEVLNTRRIMHLFSDRLKSETTYQSAASFSCMPARRGETQRSGNHPNARSVPLTIWKIVPDTFIGARKGDLWVAMLFLKTSVGIALSPRYIARQRRSARLKETLYWQKPNDGSIWLYRSLRLTFRPAEELRASSQNGKQPDAPVNLSKPVAIFCAGSRSAVPPSPLQDNYQPAFDASTTTLVLTPTRS